MGVSCRLTDRRRLVRAASNAGHKFSSPIQLFPASAPRVIGQINVQGQQFISRCEVSFGRMIHLVPEMNSFSSQFKIWVVKRAGRLRELPDISNVHIGDEGCGVGFLSYSRA